MIYLFSMSVISEIEKKYKKPHVVDVKSGDSVKVHQKIKEGNKERVQIFEGLVIKTSRKNSHTATIAVRRIASGVGVEKTFLLHSPLVTKVEVTKRSKVRRNFLSYMRERTGKSARLSGVDFNKDEVNYVPEPEVKEEPKVSETSQEEAPSEEAPKKEKPKDEAQAEDAEKQSEDKSDKDEKKEPKVDSDSSKSDEKS